MPASSDVFVFSDAEDRVLGVNTISICGGLVELERLKDEASLGVGVKSRIKKVWRIDSAYRFINHVLNYEFWVWLRLSRWSQTGSEAHFGERTGSWIMRGEVTRWSERVENVEKKFMASFSKDYAPNMKATFHHDFKRMVDYKNLREDVSIVFMDETRQDPAESDGGRKGIGRTN